MSIISKTFKSAKFRRTIKLIQLTLFSITIFSLSVVIMGLVMNWTSSASNQPLLAGEQLSLQSLNLPVQIPIDFNRDKPLTVEITSKQIAPPTFGSTAVLAIDYDTGQILYQKNIHQRLAPASTTKVMTALVSIEHFKMGDMLLVYPEDLVEGSTMGLKAGEMLTYRGLLYGMLLNSGNDAAYTIASNYPGGLAAFMNRMNQLVSQLSLKNTHFQNPAGFDAYDHYSSAYDLSVIAKQAVEHPTLARVVATQETLVSTLDQTQEHNLKNLNELLDVPGVIGIKTGFTEKAGENFVGLIERDHHKVITVVLGSSDRFGETKQLMDWVYQNYSWEAK